MSFQHVYAANWVASVYYTILSRGSTRSKYDTSETYVVPDIDGQFPTDLSDSDDDFFEKK